MAHDLPEGFFCQVIDVMCVQYISNYWVHSQLFAQVAQAHDPLLKAGQGKKVTILRLLRGEM